MKDGLSEYDIRRNAETQDNRASFNSALCALKSKYKIKPQLKRQKRKK